jgi:hypothetical protein
VFEYRIVRPEILATLTGDVESGGVLPLKVACRVVSHDAILPCGGLLAD